jgi:hypothetical protein
VVFAILVVVVGLHVAGMAHGEETVPTILCIGDSIAPAGR